MKYQPSDLAIQNKHLYEFMKTTEEIREYIKVVSELVKHEYQVGRLDIYSYERIINCITVIQLQSEEIGKESKNIANQNIRTFTNNHYLINGTRIDSTA